MRNCVLGLRRSRLATQRPLLVSSYSASTTFSFGPEPVSGLADSVRLLQIIARCLDFAAFLLADFVAVIAQRFFRHINQGVGVVDRFHFFFFLGVLAGELFQ